MFGEHDLTARPATRAERPGTVDSARPPRSPTDASRHFRPGSAKLIDVSGRRYRGPDSEPWPAEVLGPYEVVSQAGNATDSSAMSSAEPCESRPTN